MKSDKSLLDVKAHLETRYGHVRLIDSGPGQFVQIGNSRRSATISICEDGWFVELWAATDRAGDEDCVDEQTIRHIDYEINRLCEWLDGVWSKNSDAR